MLATLADNIHNLRVICVAHGSPILTDCNQRLREAAEKLRKNGGVAMPPPIFSKTSARLL